MRPDWQGVARRYPKENGAATLRQPESARVFQFWPGYVSYRGQIMVQVTPLLATACCTSAEILTLRLARVTVWRTSAC